MSDYDDDDEFGYGYDEDEMDDDEWLAKSDSDMSDEESSSGSFDSDSESDLDDDLDKEGPKKINNDEDSDEDDFVGTYTKKIEPSPLHKACTEGNAAQVQSILSSLPHGFVDVSDPETGRSPMDIACAKGFAEIVAILLQHGSQIKPLKKAISGGNPKVVELLLESGANVYGVDILGYTPILVAALKGDVEIAKILLAHGADPNVKANRDEDYVQPIHFAASGGHPQMVKLLLAEGVDVNARTSNNETPFYFAAQNGSVEVARLLLSKGADFNTSQRDTQDTPLLIAIKNGHAGVVRLLLENGAPLPPRKRDTLFLLACGGSLEVLNVLADLGIKEAIGTSHFIAAAEVGKTDIIQWLWEIKKKGGKYKMLVFERDINLGLVLARACEGGHLELVKMLVGQKANVNYSHNGESIIEIVCRSKKASIELVQFLLQSGAQTNLPNSSRKNKQMTSNGALKNAIKLGRMGIVQALLQHGAFASQQHLLRACMRDNVEMVRMVYEALGKKNVEEALEAAVKRSKVNVVAYLLEKEPLRPEAGRKLLSLLAHNKSQGDKEIKIGQMLLQKGSNLNGAAPQHLDPIALPLSSAILSGNSDLVWLFVTHGADPHFLIKGQPLLDYCGKNKQLRAALLHFWTPSTHRFHPEIVKKGIKCLLLVAQRQKWNFGKEIMYHICAYVAYDWTPIPIPERVPEEEPPQKTTKPTAKATTAAQPKRFSFLKRFRRT
eukprot:Phypoly_transcript_03857.p1 GENE.Phypoly_transcript_03857~~Phypoly_transcript_03857.p1  ORF type:complete len:722 (+),score=129.74 Phypoly_transcript_03857:58-2223(+)